MARLFIFAIGGTGSRVLKSLTMLLAAGVKPASEKQYDIVPIIIDPHKDNKDLQRTRTLMENYQAITDETGTGNGFFATKISTLDKLVSSQGKFKGNFTFNLQQVSNTKFRDYLNYNLLQEANRALTDLLFSGKSVNDHGDEVNLLDIEMSIGFVGNPNVGSVVLNQFKDSDEFREFANNFNEEDRIFIISSIFGGTGAAGFPTVLKNIRDARNNDAINSKGFLENARIGALTILPYFNVEKDAGSPIQKSDWIAKTKAALHYYKDNITGREPAVNALYYIGDDYAGKPYTNDPGEGGQKNNAHFVELASALAIIDFLEIPDRELTTVQGVAERPIYREFGIKRDEATLGFLDLGNIIQQKLNLRLTQLFFFKKYLDEQLQHSLDKQSYSTDNRPDSPPIKSSFCTTPFYRNYFTDFMNAFQEWLTEMADNKRGFAPFNHTASLKASVSGIKPSSGFLVKELDYDYFDTELSKISGKGGFTGPAQKFIKLFFVATGNILKNKFDHFKVMQHE